MSNPRLGHSVRLLVVILIPIGVLTTGGSSHALGAVANPTHLDEPVGNGAPGQASLPASCRFNNTQSSILVVEGDTDGADSDGHTGNQEDSDSDDIYGSIQAAANRANDSAVVCVLPDTYRERIDVRKNVTLIAPKGAVLNGSNFEEVNDGASGPFGIQIGDHVSPTIDGFTITRYADAIVDYEGTGHWTVTNVTILNTTDDGIGAQFTTGSWTIKNTVINGTDRLGVHVGVGNWTIENTTIRNIPVIGIAKTQRSGGDWTVRDTTIENIGAVGIRVYPGNLLVKNTRITNASFAGISSNQYSTYTGQVTGQWIIRNVTIRDSGRGLFDASTTLQWNVRDTQISNSSVSGIVAENATGEWEVQNVTIQASDKYGVKLSRATGDWQIEDSTIRDNPDGGIVAEQTNGNVTIRNTSLTEWSTFGINAKGANRRVNATHNWWGTDGGPDSGDCIGNVTCGRWLLEPPARKNNVKTGPPPVIGEKNPQDLDGDGQYEDIDGDGEFTIVDIQSLFTGRESDTVQNNPDKFDFNNDGAFSIADVQRLFSVLK